MSRSRRKQDLDLSKADRSRENILDAAAKLFRNKGYAATTLRDIANAASMKAGSIYYHFRSKEELLITVLDLGMRAVSDAVTQAIDALPPSADFRARITVALRTHLIALFRHGDYTSANIRIFGQIPKSARRQHQPVRAAYGQYWHGLLKAGQAAGEVKADVDLGMARMMVLGAMNWATDWYESGTHSLDRVARAFAALFLNGILKR